MQLNLNAHVMSQLESAAKLSVTQMATGISVVTTTNEEFMLEHNLKYLCTKYSLLLSQISKMKPNYQIYEINSINTVRDLIAELKYESKQAKNLDSIIGLIISPTLNIGMIEMTIEESPPGYCFIVISKFWFGKSNLTIPIAIPRSIEELEKESVTQQKNSYSNISSQNYYKDLCTASSKQSSQQIQSMVNRGINPFYIIEASKIGLSWQNKKSNPAPALNAIEILSLLGTK